MKHGSRPPLSGRDRAQTAPTRARGPGQQAPGERGAARLTGRDVAGAGVLMLSANLLCAGIGAAVGALLGALVPLAVAGFLIGFFVGIYVVTKRFREF
jgi:hypothetical protein